ncbi:tungsten cofactor oxidoreductase radical SAM maturase [Alkaliphilus crotonatoxidans]
MKDLGYHVTYHKSKTIRKLYLELTDRCNLDCTICYRKSWNRPFQDMTRRTLQQIYKELETLEGLEEIVLGGIGEPTCHPDIVAVLERLKGYHLHMTTNGTLMTDSLMEAMVNCLNEITISVDGVDHYYSQIRGIPLTKVVNSIERLQRAKKISGSPWPEVQLQFVSSEKNIDSLFQVIDLAKELDCHRVIVSSLIPQVMDNKDQILYQVEPNPSLKELWNRARIYGLRKGITLKLPHTSLKTERECSFMNDVTTFISAEGEVMPCYRLSHDYEEFVFGRRKQVSKHSFGNILAKPLLDIWNSSDYQQYRYVVHNNLYPSCMDCDLAEGCEFPKGTEEDCYGCRPSCADCLWSRGFVICP